jgi:hypothetical protein
LVGAAGAIGFFSLDDVALLPSFFRCMNLMPIVELESFFATAATAAAPPTLEPLLSGTTLFGCCSDGVLFLGLDEPGFHILSAIAIVVVDGMNDVVVVLDDGFWVAARGQHFLAGAQKIRREPERYGGNSKDMAGTKFNFKDMAGTSKIWREPQRYGGNSKDMAGTPKIWRERSSTRKIWRELERYYGSRQK